MTDHASSHRRPFGVISSGERNSKLTSIAGWLRKRGLMTSELTSELLLINEMSCRPPLREQEVRGIVKSVSRYATHSVSVWSGRPAKVAKAAKVARPEATASLIHGIWIGGEPGQGSLIANYFRVRGLSGDVPSGLRFSPRLLHKPSRKSTPAMIAAVTMAPTNDLVAVHRTYLAEDGTGKAAVEPCRMALGPIRGGAIRLAEAGELLVVAEGIETALSIQEATGYPAWAAISAGNLPALVLPALPLASLIIIGADPDAAGQRYAVEAAQRWCYEGRRVRIATPQHGDFNDVLRGIA
jgi:putative DNA primase/helicase